VITSATPTAVPNLVQIRRWGLLGKWVKYNEKFFIYTLSFMNSPTGQTRRRIFTLDGGAKWLAQGCAFWGFRWHCSPFWGWNPPQNPNFGGVNRRFQAKRAKYWKFHDIETTASISTKFCTTIETIKWLSWLVPIGAQQIQDGGRPPFWKKPLNRYISATV